MEDVFKQVFPESFAGRTALQNFLANQAVSDRKTTERSTAWREEIQQAIGFGLAREIAETWLQVEFEGGRHARRVEKITALEKRC